MVVLFDSGTLLFADYADGYRTEQTLSLPDAVRVWRRTAWQQDDFFAQVRLGDLYSQNQSFAAAESPKNPSFLDPVEAYVWYYLALRPGRGRSVLESGDAPDQYYTTRNNALKSVQAVYDALTFEQRLEARARIIYVLSSRGANGFMVLGRIHGLGMDYGWRGQNQPNDNSNKPYVLACWRSWWERGSIRASIWSFFAAIFPLTDPRPPHWAWVKRTQENYDSVDHMMPDDYSCRNDTTIPPEPTENLLAVNGGGGGNDAVLLNKRNADQGNGLAVSPVGGNAGGNMNGMGGGNGGGNGGGGGDAFDLVVARNGGGGGGAGGIANPGALGGGGAMAAQGAAGGAWNGGWGGGDDQYGWSVPSVFVPSATDALTYFQIAATMGHPLAASYAAAVRSNIRYYTIDATRVIADAEKRARYWAPPFEYYPGMTAGGIIHTDESLPDLEQRIALGRVGEIPPQAIMEALAFRGFLRHGSCHVPACFRKPVAAFQSSLGFEPTGFLTPPQIVRLIQMAAVDGDADSQDRLGIMYAKGVGVPQNFVRAEKWFMKAANQRHGDALFNLYVLYKVGPNGIEPDEHKAVSYNTEAALAGYNPSRCELMDLLRQADDAGHDHPDGGKK